MKSLSNKDLQQLIRYLEDEEISAKEALEVIKKEFEVNFDHMRTKWKMMRFTLYLWARLEEEKSGYLGKKSDTVRRLVRSKKYVDQFNLFGSSLTVKGAKPYKVGTSKADDEAFFEIQFKQLNQLITDPRQVVFFREKYFVYEGQPKKHIPQEIIDRIR